LTFGVLAAAAASSSASSASGNVTPGVLGFLVVAAMGVALVFLLRSMNKQFRKIAPEAEDAASQGTNGADETEGAEGAKPGQTGVPKQDTPA
jgi:ABC-type sulfate transport system permease component